MPEISQPMDNNAQLSALSCEAELDKIARWWLRYGMDTKRGGFVGEVASR